MLHRASCAMHAGSCTLYPFLTLILPLSRLKIRDGANVVLAFVFGMRTSDVIEFVVRERTLEGFML